MDSYVLMLYGLSLCLINVAWTDVVLMLYGLNCA
jgi:hypothetical protein